MPAETAVSPGIFVNRVHLKGFKSIEDLSIDFQKGLNILIGKNGAGKSNFLECLYQAMIYYRFGKTMFNYAMLDFGSDDHHTFVFELEKVKGVQKELMSPLDRTDLSLKVIIDGEDVFDTHSGGYLNPTVEINNKIIKMSGHPGALFGKKGHVYIYPLFIKFNLPDNIEYVSLPGTLKINFGNEMSFWESPDSFVFIANIFLELEFVYSGKLNEFISNFHDILQSRLQSDIIDNLQLYSPIEDIRFNNNINIYETDKTIIIENIKLEFKINGSWLPWSQLSDGTKRLFYIISEVTYSNGLILIEEPELGIHPHQFNLLMNFLKEQSEHKQIIISTHSPKALDILSPDELNRIVITYYDPKTGTQMRHLSGKEINKAKKYMQEVGFFSDYWMHSDLEE